MRSSNQPNARTTTTSAAYNQYDIAEQYAQDAMQNTSGGAFLQPQLTVGRSGDKYEKEADSAADSVMKGNSVPQIQRMANSTSNEDEETMPGVQTKEKGEQEENLQMESVGATGGGMSASPQLTNQIQAQRGGGQPLDSSVRKSMEGQFGESFSDVRVHQGGRATNMNQQLQANAFTVGNDIFFNEGRYAPETAKGQRLIAHELTHTIQQGGKSSGVQRDMIQRELNVAGAAADVRSYLDVLGEVSGYNLNWVDPGPQVTIAGDNDFGAESTEARAILRQIIEDPDQHASITVGTHQHRVGVGAWPGVGGGAQRVDIDDITALNTHLPGHGNAKAFHELVENYDANSAANPPFAPSHQLGVDIESDVLEASTIQGRRLTGPGGGGGTVVIPAPAGMPAGPNIQYQESTQAFTSYFLVMTYRRTVAGGIADFEIVGARRIPKRRISRYALNDFEFDNDAVPAVEVADLASALADLNANANSSVLIEGHTDSVGTEEYNDDLGSRRAQSVRDWFIANGIQTGRIAMTSQGEAEPATDNRTDAGRSTNRRVILTIHGR